VNGSNKLIIVFSFCPECGSALTPPRQFNLMFKPMSARRGPDSVAYLRRKRAAISRSSKRSSKSRVRRFLSASRRSAKHFATKSTAQLHLPLARVRADGTRIFIRPDEAIDAISGRVAIAAEIGIGNRKSEIRTGAGKPGTSIGSKSASIGMRTSACRALHWRNTGRSRTNWPITPGPPLISLQVPFGTQELEGIAAPRFRPVTTPTVLRQTDERVRRRIEGRLGQTRRSEEKDLAAALPRCALNISHRRVCRSKKRQAGARRCGRPRPGQLYSARD